MTAFALAGKLTFNPETDVLTGKDGKTFKLKNPWGEELPKKGFDQGENTYQAPSNDGSKVQVKFDPNSQRLKELKPFEPWDGKDFVSFSHCFICQLTPSKEGHVCSDKSERKVHN